MFRSNEQSETDVRILANFIKLRLIDEKAERCTYSEMSAAIGGRDIQNGSRAILIKARKEVEKSHGVCIGTVTRIGINIVDDLCGVADKTIKHIGRASKKTTARILNALTDNLPAQQSIGVHARLAVISTLVLCSKTTSVKKIEGALKATGKNELPTAETLRLFEK